MKLNILYIIIGVLIITVLLQRCGGGSASIPPPKIDTIINYIEVHDTVKGRTKFIKGDVDTLWMDSLIYVPDTSYEHLLEQYKNLGNKYFSTNIFKSDFELGQYGKAIITDSIKANQLISSSISYNLSIPEKTITIEKQAPLKKQVYLGLGVYGNKNIPISGAYVGALYKDRKDRIFGYNIGYNNSLQIGISSYWKLKL
jgi:hypothetical protein